MGDEQVVRICQPKFLRIRVMPILKPISQALSLCCYKFLSPCLAKTASGQLMSLPMFRRLGWSRSYWHENLLEMHWDCHIKHLFINLGFKWHMDWILTDLIHNCTNWKVIPITWLSDTSDPATSQSSNVPIPVQLYCYMDMTYRVMWLGDMTYRLTWLCDIYLQKTKKVKFRSSAL